MTAQTSEKRRFHRIGFDAQCELHWEEQVWTSELIDISLKGVLVRRPQGWTVPLKQPCEVVIHLDDNETGIVMA
ncbi:MAG: PilZ domain-containing protein, partial [Marinobacter sp.]|nr:PilZ domain-containing protein [Marinobacter sp.]